MTDTDTTISNTARSYAAHFDGTDCPECGEPCRWDDQSAQLRCRCSNRDYMSVWLGNTPT